MNHHPGLDPAMNERSGHLSSPEGGKKVTFPDIGPCQRPKITVAFHFLCPLWAECRPFLSKCWTGDRSPLSDSSFQRMMSIATLYASLGPHCPFGAPSHVNTLLQAILQMWHFILESLLRGHMDNILKLQERKKGPTEAEPLVQGHSYLVDRDLRRT